jgi:hypothetical protein
MPITPEQFALCAQIEKQIREQSELSQTVVTEDTLRGCVFTSIVFSSKLGLTRADVVALVGESFDLWTEFSEVKKRLAAKRKKA